MSKAKMLGYNKPFKPNNKAPGICPRSRQFSKSGKKQARTMDAFKCKNCGKPIDHIVMSVFNYDGTDCNQKFPLIDLKEIPLHSCPVDAVYMEATANWTDYELTEEEQIEGIRCPYCGKFPFARKEVQVYDIVRVVCFTK